MKFLSRVVWSEGMPLGPHHFQTQSRYFEDTLWFRHENSRPYPWGCLHLALDEETITNGRAILTSATGIMPDGLIFDIAKCDPVPEPAVLKELFTPSDSALTLYLAIPDRPKSGLVTSLDGGSDTRYSAVMRTVRDETMTQDEQAIYVARKNFIVCSQAQLHKDTISLPIARILRNPGGGGFINDPDFIPPCLQIGASKPLVVLLNRLAETVQAKIDSVRRQRRGLRGMELGTSALDVANYWFLHCLCSAMPALRHHLQVRRSHPQDVYRDLARMAGALSTFALEGSPDEVPPYCHDDLTETFCKLDALIRRYLEVVVPSNSLTLDFTRARGADGREDPYSWNASVVDERCLRRARWIFGIRSPIGESTLLRRVPEAVKVCSSRGIGTLVRRALSGLQLLHLPVPPSAMSAQADMHYFSISLSGLCWDDILTTRQVGVYLPAELGDATFDLTVITETSA